MIEQALALIGRLLVFLIGETILGTLFYVSGWPVIKLVSLGRFPQRRWLRLTLMEADVDDFLVFWVGFGVLMFVLWWLTESPRVL